MSLSLDFMPLLLIGIGIPNLIVRSALIVSAIALAVAIGWRIKKSE